MEEHGGDPTRPSPGFGQQTVQREAAFNSIFGAAPAGRSQTMRSQTIAPQDRTQTMVHGTPDPRQRLPLQSPYTIQATNGYSFPTTMSTYQPDTLSSQEPNMPDRQAFPRHRTDARIASGPPNFHRPTSPPTRVFSHAPESTPALLTNSYRTQSLAMNNTPVSFQSAGANYGISAAQTFRQQTYLNGGNGIRTTAQGRIVPERHDERTMSMTVMARGPDHLQTLHGGTIPDRRRGSNSAPHELPGSEPQHSRPSIESHASTPTLIGSLSRRTTSQDSQSSRTMSMASTLSPSADRTTSMTTRARPSLPQQGSSSVGLSSNGSLSNHTSSNALSPATTSPFPRRRPPIVYPALLSRVADAFRERIILSDKEKDGLEYKNAFTGQDSVDLIAYIMQTTDRYLALLLGRSLDAQKLFHEVSYVHRLRDSGVEIYQLRDTISDESSEVNGVFTLTTECYSPTCTPDHLCYSIACPKRVDQQKRLNMKPQSGLRRAESRISLHEEQSDEQKLWINTVSKEVADSVGDKEKKRQEVISELMYTERDFVKDLEYLRDFWMQPLRGNNSARQSPIPEHKRERFIRGVFSNCLEVYAVNSRLAESLTRRQQQNPVVRNVGDVFLDYIPKFGPFIKYGANQLMGKLDFEKEKQSNPSFSRFVDETERLKESRKLELNGYLTKPTTRLARYPLLLEGILKYTADDNPDKVDLPQAIAGIKDVLSRVNAESGRAENRYTLMQLNAQLVWRPGEYVDLKLTDDSRQMLHKSALKKSPTDTNGDIQGFLFDNALLFVRAKTVNKREELKVYKRPIPLGLLVIPQMEEQNPRAAGLRQRPSSSLIPGTRSSGMSLPRQDTTRQQGHPITFRHLGRGGFEQTLYCNSQFQRERWMKVVSDQQRILRERSNIFTKTKINEGFFTGGLSVNCCVPIDGGRKLVVGTDTGLYVAERKPKDASAKPRRVLDCKSVTQVDVLEQHAILLVLTDKILHSYSLDALDPEQGQLAPSKRGKRLSPANFFKVGVFDGQHLVCCVKTSALSATIKVFKPLDVTMNNKKKSGIGRILAGGDDVLSKPHKIFYVPTETYSIHFLRSSLCVGCARGFEIVTLDTLVTQPLLDQADTSLDFVALKENLKPIHVERINRDFLLCYSDFSFFVDRHGWRAFPEWKITWEGTPTSFAIFQPYILAFEPSFIEIRNMDTGSLVYILTAKNVRMLHSSTREILYAYEDELGEDVIASLDFWVERPR